MPSVFELLDKEWRRLGQDPHAAAELRDVCQVAGGATTLDGLEQHVRQASPPDADRVLLALVERAVEGHALAARVLLQLLLPGARRMARRWWALGDRDERSSAAIVAVYHRIVGYPLARRPGRVAANILLDAERELRRAVPSVVPVPSVELVRVQQRSHLRDVEASPALDPAVELAEVLRDAVSEGVVDHEDAELIARSRIAGDRVADIAETHGLRPRTLWDRRQRAEAALVRAAQERRPAS